MTPERYAIALVLFHALVLLACLPVARAWSRSARCRLPIGPWLRTLFVDGAALAVFAYAVSLVAPTALYVADWRFRYVGEISGRLMGQVLFGEAILLGVFLAWRHRQAGENARAVTLAAAALALFAVYLEAYRIEPFQLEVRRHVVDGANGLATASTLRILHMTDIQTSAIGAHEARALQTGLSFQPDLIVLTGDYVQDSLGRPTEVEAARDLRALIARVGFQARLGVFATEGDVGPPCRDVFAGTGVRCVVDETVLVRLPSGETLRITGLSRGRGRERSSQWLARLLAAGPRGDHQLVISHAPDFVDALPWSVDLVLAGHTHGGQFVLPFWGPLVTASRLPRRYAGGLEDYRGTPLHVSRGVGMERGFAPPVRFLCPPEICVLDVRLPRATDSARVMIPPDERISPGRDRSPEGP